MTAETDDHCVLDGEPGSPRATRRCRLVRGMLEGRLPNPTLTTLRNADRILVFDAGRIVQEGDFKALSETKGLFQDFLQQRDTELDVRGLGTLPAGSAIG